MCFNVDFIIDFLNAVDCEKVQVSLRDTNYQAVLSQDRPEEEGVHRYVVMPLRLD